MCRARSRRAQLIGSFVLLNLAVAVILDSVGTLHRADPGLVSPSDMETFAEVWAEFDPDATNFISTSQLPDLLLRLPAPLGLSGEDPRKVRKLCLLMPLKQHLGGVAFSEVLQELVNNCFFREHDLDKETFTDLVADVEMPDVDISDAATVNKPKEDLPQLVLEQDEASKAFAIQIIKRYAPNVLERLRQRRAMAAQAQVVHHHGKLRPRSVTSKGNHVHKVQRQTRRDQREAPKLISHSCSAEHVASIATSSPKPWRRQPTPSSAGDTGASDTSGARPMRSDIASDRNIWSRANRYSARPASWSLTERNGGTATQRIARGPAAAARAAVGWASSRARVSC